LINFKNCIEVKLHFLIGVVTLDGLLYVIGGQSDEPIDDTVEMYNPITNTWTMETLSRRGIQIYGGVVVNRPPRFTTN